MKKTKTDSIIREYIYLDNLEVNSILAQFEDGIPKVIEEIKQSTESNTEGTTGKMSTKANGGLQAGVKGEVSFGGELGTNNSETNSDMYQEAISTVYHDYAVNIMTDELEEHGLLKLTTKQPEGAFVQLKSNFELIDPVSVSSNLDNDIISFMLSFADGDDGDTISAKEGFSSIAQFGNLLNSLFPDSILIKTNNALSIAEKSNFRMNTAQLKSLVLSKRKITIIGKIESLITEESLNLDAITNNLETNPALFTSLMPTFSFTILNTLNLIKKDDRLIKPIAIYFE